MRDAYIVSSVRTPGCRRAKGAFKDTRPEDLLSFIMQAAVEKTGTLAPKEIDDVMIGCSFPEAEQGLNIGRLATQIAGFPVSVSGATINRFCSSGLEAIALASLRDEVFSTTLATAVCVFTSINNEQAVRAYEKAGFEWRRIWHDPNQGPMWLLVAQRPER